MLVKLQSGRLFARKSLDSACVRFCVVLASQVLFEKVGKHFSVSKETTFDRIGCIVGLAHSLWVAKNTLFTSFFLLLKQNHPDLQAIYQPGIYFRIRCVF